jgi:hypothetical protein
MEADKTKVAGTYVERKVLVLVAVFPGAVKNVSRIASV